MPKHYISDFPDLLAQWHPTKNGDLLPSKVACGSIKKVWWLCPVKCIFGCLHEYQQAPNHKTKGTGCPYCAPNTITFCYHQSLEFQCPEISKQWHPTKNGSLLPSQITYGSDKKVFWLCPNICQYGCLHEYQQTVANKTNGQGCPYCSPKHSTICYHQSLEFQHPEISKQWHPTKNGDLLPSHITSNCSKKVFWLCPNTCQYGCLHEYQQTVANKTNGQGCPYCSPESVIICYHQSFEFQHPEISKQWHPTKNGQLLPSKITSGSQKKVFWLCPNTCQYGCLHEYAQRIADKTNGNGCPYCSNPPKSICYHQSFEFKCPDFTKSWHPTKNGKLLPSMVTCRSEKLVWWICENGHEYQQMICSKTNGYGCPRCNTNGYSKKQIIWLTFLSLYHNIQIRHAKNEGEFKIPNTNYKADGYCQETNTIYEFHGDYWHGNPQIYNSNDLNKLTKTTFGELYTKTITKEMKLKELGYNLVIMWEYDWIRINKSIGKFQKKCRCIRKA